MIGLLAGIAGLPLALRSSLSLAPPPGAQPPRPELERFEALDPIDTHVHVFKSDPQLYTLLQRLHLHLLDICVVAGKDPGFPRLDEQISSAQAVAADSSSHISWCTTFDPFPFPSERFAADVIRQLDRDFANGAGAVKIWKNIGMELKTPDGKYVMPDDPRFAPIYRDIAAHHKTLVAHIAEPTSCWQPLDPANPDFDYYKAHPEWYMYDKPDHPSKERLLAARDHLLAAYPDLRVVGAHLGSMELNVDEIASHFDRYPNFAVDTAARAVYLAMQPRDKVQAFLIKYQDRVLYGTDLGYRPKGDSDDLQDWESTYLRDWNFFATDQTVVFDGRKVQGLALPQSVLHKLYHDNAVRWFPGIVDSGSRR